MRTNRWLAAAAVVGTTVGVLSFVRWPHALAAGLSAVSCALGVSPGRTRALCFWIAVLFLAGARGARVRDVALDPPLARWLESERARRDTSRHTVQLDAIDLEGQIAEDAESLDGTARVTVDISRAGVGGRWSDARGRVLLTVGGALTRGEVARWTAGRRLRTVARLRLPAVSRNPGEPSDRWQVVARRVDAIGHVKSALLVEVESGYPWSEAAAAVRRAVRERVARAFRGFPAEVGAIVSAVLIGDRAGLDPSLQDRLQRAGTYHVIAISGGNIALLTAAVYWFLRVATSSTRLRALITLAVVLGYGQIVGPEPSVTRAVVAAAVYLSCAAVALQPSAPDVIALAATLIVLVDPRVVTSGGAWLTFGATMAIVLVSTRGRPQIRSTTLVERGWRLATDLWRATLAAEAALLPLSAWLFTRVSAAGLLLNFVAVPMMTVVQLAGAAALLIGELPLCGPLLQHVAAGAALAITESSRLVDIVPWLSWRVPRPAAGTIALFYLVAAVWLLAPLQWWQRRGVECLAAAVAVGLLWAPLTSWARPAQGWLRVTMLDVGQGESVLVQPPGGPSLLLDAGSRTPRFDAGERTVVPAVWASGERRIGVFAFTHGDLDHLGGGGAVLGALSPTEIWEGVPVFIHTERAALHADAVSRSMPWRVLQRGDRWSVGQVELDVLHPPLPDWERQRVRNNDSLVLRLRYLDVEFLLTGDIDAETERTLPLDTTVPVRVLKVAHHGSGASTSEVFLRRYAPQVAMISVGRGNPFGHPAPAVLRRLNRNGAHVFRTDLDGALIVETDGHEVRVRGMRGRTWTVRAWRARA